jgi:hypothetical protein
MLMMTYSAYSTSPTQQQSFYRNDLDGIIFEFTAINVSNRFATLPTFENIPIDGFKNVSAIATIPINASTLDRLFYFEGYGYGNDTANIIPVMYGINTSYKFDLSYSDASLTYGAINNSGYPPLKSDYVNYLAYAITGGYNLASIFSNEALLLQEVKNMNTSFNNKINESVSNLSKNFTTETSKIVNINNASVFFDNVDNNSIYVQGCKILLDGLLSIPSSVRGEKFFTNIESQTSEPINANASSTLSSYYYIKFYPGDILSIVLNYVPYNGNASSIIGDNLVYTRSYKILLNCT